MRESSGGRKEERLLGRSLEKANSSDTYLSKEEKSVMLRLRQKLLLWMGFESQEERLRWLESELKRLRLSRELRSVVHELVDEGEGLGPR